MVVFVNRRAAAGAGLKKWETVWEVVRSRLGQPRVCIMDGQETTRRSIEREIFSGETRFIAAGGDGTVNFIANTLAAVTSAAQRDLLSLGAVGTGSSNDFHKPFRRETLHRGIPLTLDFDNTISRDIGCVTYDDQGVVKKRYFLVNASIGVTANANGFFNVPDRTLSAIKRCSTGGAILYAALHTIVGYRNIPVTICSGERMFQNVDLSNLGITKSPWLSGGLCYGGVPNYTDGLFGVFLCRSMSAGDLVQLLGGLQRGVFPQTGGKTEVWKSDSVTVSSAVPFSVECDGEVVRTRCARFDVIPRFLKVCR